MPHDAATQTHWHEPKAGENAGHGKFGRPEGPYDKFMESEGVPIYRGVGVHRVQNLPMKPWKRLGGKKYQVHGPTERGEAAPQMSPNPAE